MSEMRAMVAETAARLFGALGGDFAADMAAVEAAGLGDLLVSADAGGFGGDWGDAAAVLRLAGAAAVALPIGELMLARRLACDAGIDTRGLLTIAAVAEGVLADGGFSGALRDVPWGGDCVAVLAVVDGRLLRLAVSDAVVTRGANMAGEPRDALVFDGAAVAAGAAPALFEFGALLRVLQVAGALEAALKLSVDYVNGREQFGRKLAAFQAVQQLLSQFAVEVAAVEAAAAVACEAADAGDAGFAIAVAKIRANLAIGVGTAAAHQVHGAIGFTQEYGLHLLTRRLWSWRGEFGHDAFWSVRLGNAVAAAGGDAFWPQLVARSDAHNRRMA